ncbi:single-stranded DNA-binding protein [Sporosarcina sp.]|uniref:single-stranded DNA-binding protein n=1 Tax=Sporosarcina sp. TaxID=49982 RepID=UPI002606193D|nr:single-stranded DNA-binding protein [Sporosarcina sp.]
MIRSKKRWQIDRPDEQLVAQLSADLNVSAMLAKILVARNVTDSVQAAGYLQMDETSLHDPYLLFDMEKSVDLLRTAINEQQQITVYGDYDAGATRF